MRAFIAFFALVLLFADKNVVLLCCGRDFYSFVVKDIHGNDFELEKLRGTVTLAVNVASQCGYTDSHYRALTKLQESLGSDGKFQVLAFPCNQFGAQEPGSPEEIIKFTHENYGINFVLLQKSKILGENANEAFTYLIGENGVGIKVLSSKYGSRLCFLEESGKSPDWNFWKYLVGPDGKVTNAWSPNHSVDMAFDDIARAVSKAGGNAGFSPDREL